MGCGTEDLGSDLAQCQPSPTPCPLQQQLKEGGIKTSNSLFQWQETTTSKQSKLKSNRSAGSCQALGLLEPAPLQSYKNTVLRQHLGNTEPGIAQIPCPPRAGLQTPPPPLPKKPARRGIAQQLGSRAQGPGGEGDSVSLNYLYKN